MVTALVEGAFEVPRWGRFLDRLRLATGADYAILSFRPPGRPLAEAVTLLSGDAQSKVDDPRMEDFPPGEPPVDELLLEGKSYSMDELFGRRATPQSRLYRDFLVQKGIATIRQMRVQEASGVHAWLTVARHGSKDFTSAHDALLSSLARVLRGVLRQYVALERERFEASLTAEPIRQLQFGWLTLDRAGHVLDCDKQGDSVLSQSGVLSRGPGGRLTASPMKLERQIFQTLRRVADNPLSRPHAVPLSRDPWLDMLLVPGRRKSISAKATPAAIAYVHGDSWRSTDRCEQLAQLFGLSPQEARLALALCRGMTIAEAASEFGLAVGTARNYSKSIYAKTGARGQPDLVRIVMRSVLAIAPGA